MKKSELYDSIREMIVSELSEEAYTFDTPSGKQTGEFPTTSAAQAFDQRNNNVKNIKKLEEEEQLDEMAKIAGDLKAAIEKVIEKNKDAEKKDVRKAIKADDEVVAALGDEDLFDNQLNKFIDLVRGDREVGQRGRKADPDKPQKEKGTRGRPKSATPAVKKEKDAKFVTSKLNKSYTTSDEEGPSDKELKQLARSGGKFDKDKLSQLRQQEKTKMVRAFLKSMQDKGVVDSANRVLDKDAYAKEWADAKVDIEAKVAAIK
jgi:hypothetical protein